MANLSSFYNKVPYINNNKMKFGSGIRKILIIYSYETRMNNKHHIQIFIL